MPKKELIKIPAIQYAVNYFFAFALFLLCRIIFIIANKEYYSDTEFSHLLKLIYGGLKFDFASIFYLSAVSFFMMIIPMKFSLKSTYTKIAKYFFVIPVSIGLFANLYDTAMFPFNGRRTNFSFFKEFSNENNLLGVLLKGFVDFWPLTLAAAVMIFCLVKFYYRPKIKEEDFLDKKYTLKVLPITLLFIYFFMAGLRGSLIIDADHRPMNMNNANEYIKKSNESAIVLNTPYCILRTAGKISFSDPDYFPKDELETIYTPLHTPKKEKEFKKLNVVILILES